MISSLNPKSEIWIAQISEQYLCFWFFCVVVLFGSITVATWADHSTWMNNFCYCVSEPPVHFEVIWIVQQVGLKVGACHF